MGKYSFLNNKTIIVFIPNDFGLPQMFKQNLEYLGMKVFLLEHSETHHQLSFSDELKHISHKIFKKDRTYKNIARENNRLQIEKDLHSKMLDSLSQKTDYALIIRPDLLNNEIIEKIKNKTQKLVGYQWDGLNRYPEIYKKVKYFDHFFVFDEKDLKADPKFTLITNFYFDFNLTYNSVPEKDIFFIGSHIESRMPLLIEISSFLKKQGLKTDINIIGSSKKYIEKNPETGIIHIKEIFDFKKNYEHIKNSKAILDLLNDVHNGLSLRTFESIGLKKKLVTNNTEIKKYDFYHPENIFVLGERKLEDLVQFLSTPYHELDSETYFKYSFENWIANILETPDYLSILKHSS